MAKGLPWIENDGGRKAAGFKGDAGDCLCRAAAIVTGRSYREVYDLINELAERERYARGRLGMMAATGRKSSARTGVYKATGRDVLESLGLRWTPTMTIGAGCRVHLAPGELPAGRLVVQVSKHWTAVIDGVVYDTHDPSRDGSRCVYGYWSK